jgi:hypothetical protein
MAQLFTWKRVVIALGTAALLAGTVILLIPADIDCGVRVLGRWPVPYFALSMFTLAIGAAVLFGGLRASPDSARKLGQNLLTALISGGLTVGIIDVALRLTDPPKVFETPFYANSETLGYFTAPNAHHRFLLPDWRYASFVTDENGFIIREGGVTPDVGAQRILFLGDSFAEATQVMPDEAASVLLGQRMAEESSESVHVLNAGVSGYSPIHYLIAYNSFGPDYDPDTVVVTLYVGNDFSDAAKLVAGDRVIDDDNGEPAALRPMIEEGMAWLDLNQEPVPVEELEATIIPRETWRRGFIRTFQRMIFVPLCESRDLQQKRDELAQQAAAQPSADSVSYDLPCEVCERYADEDVRSSQMGMFRPEFTDQDQADIQITLDVLQALHDHVTADGRRLLIVIIPISHQIANQGADLKVSRDLAEGEVITSTAPQDLLMTFCAEQGIDCLDALPTFRAHDDEAVYWSGETHLTPRGQALLAEMIAEHLLSHQ